MTVTYTVPINFPDSVAIDPSAILEEAQAIEDTLIHAGHDCGEVKPWARPSLPQLSPQPKQPIL